jgi:hypothetical protein
MMLALQIQICIDIEPKPPPCIVSVDPDWDIVCRDAVTVEVFGFDTERVAAAISATLQLAPPAAPSTFLTLKFLLISEVLEALWSIKVEEGRSVRDGMKEFKQKWFKYRDCSPPDTRFNVLRSRVLRSYSRTL